MNLSKGPYENHYYALGEPIRNIVKQGQELLCTKVTNRPPLIRKYIPPIGKPIPVYSYPPVTYPQSLGELCIEIANDLLRLTHVSPNKTYRLARNSLSPGSHCFVITRRDVQTLRELLYHKNRGTL